VIAVIADWGSKDALTGAFDRACLHEGLQRALYSARTERTALSLMVFDLDHFKSVNDAFGHQRGDRALIECVQRLKRVLRTADRLFRYGGDEFVLVLPDTTKDQAVGVASRMLHCIQSVPFAGEPPLSASITLGIAVYPGDGEMAEHLFAKADARLYAAKLAGRGRLLAEDVAPTGMQSPAGASRLIEREEALQSLVAFLDALPGQSGLFAITGARGSGRSRFLAETGNIARLRGLAVLALHTSEALRVRSHGALSEALADWKGLSPDLTGHDALIAALRKRTAAKGNAGLLVTVDNLAMIDADSFGFIRRLFAAGSFPQLALIYSTDSDTVDTRGFGLDTTLQRHVQLAPLTPAGLRVWLRGALKDEPAPEFLYWLHRETRGLPGLVEAGLAKLAEQHLLRQDSGLWRVSPTYADTNLGEMLAAKSVAPRHNLPVLLTGFVGREAEIRLVKQRLQTERLLTLLGPGGSGKTRLASQVASEVLSQFSHGVCLVQLAAVLSVDEIIPAMLDALQLAGSEKSSPRAQLLQFLQSKRMLLVLDTFEHLIEGAELMTDMLQAAPYIAILVTSRERLHLPGEALLELNGLPVPEDESAQADLGGASLRLFVDRARLLDEEFTLAADQMPWAVRICQLVQGMPLGIELAAAWVRIMSCQEIAAGIARGFDFIAAHQPHVAERHSSLRAVFGHSWQCLSPVERQVYSRLSVFRGGFTRMAATQVAGASPFMLSALLDKSLLRRSASGRYEVHELLREYAVEALGIAEGEVRRGHADYYLALASEAAADLEGPHQVETCDRLTTEHANLRAALGWSIAQDEGEQALLLAGALYRFWEMRGHVREGSKWLEVALGVSHAATSPAARAAALVAAGHLLRRQGALQRGQACLEEALVIWRDLDHTEGIAETLGGLGYIAHSSGDHPLALKLLDESLHLMRASGSKKSIVWVLMGLGALAQEQGRFPEAIRLYEEGLGLGRELGHKYAITAFLNNLSVTLTSMCEYDRARAYMLECLAINREMGGKPGTAAALGNLGVLALIQGDLTSAGASLQECLAIARNIDWRIFAAIALGDLGLLARRQGDSALAVVRHAESLAIEQVLGFKLGIAYYLLGMAGVAAAGEPEQAARLLAAGESLLERIQSTPDLVYKQEREYILATVGAQLDEVAFATARAEGRALSLDEAIACAAELMRVTLDKGNLRLQSYPYSG
jgi:diguanylate cyclase (GGDEF)-like protein